MITRAPRRAAMKSSRTCSSPIRERMSTCVGSGAEEEVLVASGGEKFFLKKARASSRVERASIAAAGA